jgi:hypothetical protein
LVVDGWRDGEGGAGRTEGKDEKEDVEGRKSKWRQAEVEAFIFFCRAAKSVVPAGREQGDARGAHDDDEGQPDFTHITHISLHLVDKTTDVSG